MDNDYSTYGVGHNRPDDLAEVTKLAEQQYQAQLKVELKESELTAAKEELRKLSEQLLPEAMEAIGCADYTTTSGIHVEVKEKVRCGLPAENKPTGYTWLEDKGYGALIESKVVAPFGRTELEEANKLVEELRANKRIANLERSVHHSRLDAFLREQLEQGKEVPLQIFSVYRQRIARTEKK